MSRLKWTLIFGAWAACCIAGFAVLLRYKNTPGDAADRPPTRWPAESRLARGPHTTLLFFAHPRCVCTRAGVNELARLLPRLRPEVQATVVVLAPSDLGPGWDDTETVHRARELPGVTVVHDVDGRETLRFNAATSGFTLLYGPGGELLFHGGITPSRGHEGDSFGARRILALVRGAAADRRDSPVFGCALHAAGPAQATPGELMKTKEPLS